MHSSDPAGHPQACQALPGQGESSHLTRRERAAIATQACETCRTRKSKCDEQRPKCGLCRRLNVECTYREPQPTKKDKTMVYILDTMTRLENKVDIIGRHVSPNSTTFGPLSHSSSSSTSNLTSPPVRDSGAKHSPFDGLQASDSSYTYKHITTPHKVLLWPAIYMQQLAVRGNSAEEINQLMLEGTPWLLRHELKQDNDILPCDVMMRGLAVPETSPEATAGRRVTFPDLPVDLMSEYSHRYFDSFNMLWPILDREAFNIDILRTITVDGFAEGDSRSILALLVFALGKSALEGVSGAPIDGQQSGIRGGTAKRPPGLEIFNEARRRLGFIMTQVSVENIQCLLLTALYYEASARHVDFWRLMVSASMACQVLLKCEPIDWQSPRGEQMKRVYWTCNLIENWYHIDLDLPRTGIFDFEDAVPLPGANVVGAASENHRIFTHFAAIVSLCQLITRIHKVIFEANSPNAEAPSPDDHSGPSIAVISELARQLQSWRELLPAALQWDDNDRFSLGHQSAMQAQTSERRTSVPLFSSSARQPLHYQPDYNVLTAHLRSRYYYAHFMIFRPFVFKALHFPESMTLEDKQLAARCLRSSLLWPIAMSPCRDQKRVLPVLFAWTSNFLGILLILRMITITPMLDQIARESLDPAEVQDTVVLLLGWMKDMSQVEGIAKWSWELLRQLFSEVEGIAG